MEHLNEEKRQAPQSKKKRESKRFFYIVIYFRAPLIWPLVQTSKLASDPWEVSSFVMH